ncbi:MAG: sigma-70 family RNA polymerase sigma factor [Nitrospirae bacterium]|nr:sigma-70 family RNA polymerase sigma factor [Nitrospirota bacterium]
MERTDHELTQASDPASWLDRHGDALFRFAMLRVGDRNLAEELVQETYLAAWQAKDRYAGQSSERTWLVGILKHKVADSRRRDRARPAADSLESDEDADDLFDERGRWKYPPGDWGDSPAAFAENQEFWSVFSRCFEQLPGRLRLAFALKEDEGLDGETIRKVVGVATTNHVWVILYRARQALRRCLEVHWFAEDR